MKGNDESVLHHHSLADDPEFIKACEQALQDPKLKEQIIYILQHAGLIPVSDRQPA